MSEDIRYEQVRNLVFDMGGVLMDWDPFRIARAFADTDEDARTLAATVFGSVEWALTDAGAIDLATLIWQTCPRAGVRLQAQAEAMCRSWHEAFLPIDQTGEAIRTLKEAGYGIYLLSNAGAQFELYHDRIPAIDLFDGEVVSYREHVVKPAPEIFSRLLERYHLDAQGCLFVDDVAANVEGARRVGIQALLFGAGSAEALVRALVHR